MWVRPVASIGSVLYEKALSDDISAMQFYLKTQTGWAETSHVELYRADEPEDTY